ncbi:TetR/AcrR family transcriptional regulator [Montanilutibacter psychrotolerans]|uniref:TetR/AcrR family transcriptional regulator n=1 Tax=Montanilutibacter psychrotolerans TaxID=1327343 RepID=A0A3M8T1F6_9GAMM|nr:TetR/AcrR family transcriptional regulator [Lysobacter psychrotolerans]RNF85344.1 TetR/AcrR family transcriptional regulator [Lysobacter psychrotolerans]
MASTATIGKGAATREAIIDRAYAMACSSGLEGLSIGTLAQAVGMSKSGVFAHFGSREDLQLAVLDSAADRFLAYVFTPAMKAPRGLARLATMVDDWFDWSRHTNGGCLLLAAVSEYDDRPGPLRDRVVKQQADWRKQIAHAVQLAIDTGEVDPACEPQQMSFEIYSLALGVHHDAGLSGHPQALARGQRAYRRLIDSYRTTRNNT